MNLVSLLFDPRGAINRRAFWLGQALLLGAGAALFGLGQQVEIGLPAITVLPVLGDIAALEIIHRWIDEITIWDTNVGPGLALAALRLYAGTCLCLKRRRGMDGDLWMVVGPALAIAVLHLTVWAWGYDPLGRYDRLKEIDLVLALPPSLLLVVWLGVASKRAPEPRPNAQPSGGGELNRALMMILGTAAIFPLFIWLGLGALAGQSSVENLAYVLVVLLAVVAAVGVAAVAWVLYGLWLIFAATRDR
ncbi:MAG: hypothetical protein J7521_13155 [Caulobacter sp.]|nr:hypothetical protein [Caulobacter sp.]